LKADGPLQDLPLMNAIFRVDGNCAVTSPHAAGPWDPSMQHGSPPAALVVWAAEAIPVPVPMRIARVTEPDGILVLGAAETVVGLTDAFKPISDRRGLYAPNPAAAMAAGGGVAKFAAAAGSR